MYTDTNFKTKKALREAVAEGKKIGCFQPGLGTVPENGRAAVKGPHYPAAHTWYAEVVLVNGVITQVK